MLLIINGVIFASILSLPLTVKRVEENIELFLFAMAIVAVTSAHLLGTGGMWTLELIKEALLEPVKLTVATLVFGVIFRMSRPTLAKKVVKWEVALGQKLFAAVVVFSLGILSSIITAIIAALILCEIISALKFDKKYETLFTVLACFSIGMGASLTPVGEPLSTIAIAKLRGGAFDTDFLLLLRLVGVYLIPGIVLISVIAALLRGREVPAIQSLTEDQPESIETIVTRSLKVYLFVMALILLGKGFEPIIDTYISPLSAHLLYWLNISSAILDNATLAAAELGSRMSAGQVKGILMGVVISGGMLIPGNIPNIISASKLRISSRSWAKVGVPLGLALMVAYYLILFFL